MVRSHLAATVALAVLAGCHPEADPSALPGSEGSSVAAVTLPRSELHPMESQSVGDTFRVSIALPTSYESSEDRYPVVYALDANVWGWFGSYTEIARVAAAVEKLPEVIVVGIGYDRPIQELLALRARDLTPLQSDAQDARIREAFPGRADAVVSGGADAFLAFLRDELVPYVEARYRADPSRRVLFGHSFGGLFALHVLFREPTVFTDYIIGSPSIWYGDEVIFASEQAYADAHTDLPVNAFVSVGSLEERKDDARSRDLAMVSNVEELSRRLRSRGYPGLELETVVFDGETHNGVIPPTFSRGFRFIFLAGSAKIAAEGK